MVNVSAVHRDIMERPNVVVDRDRESAHYENCREESHRGQEQALPSGLGEPVLVDPPQPGVRDDRGERAQYCRENEGQKPEAPVRPEHPTLILAPQDARRRCFAT